MSLLISHDKDAKSYKECHHQQHSYDSSDNNGVQIHGNSPEFLCFNLSSGYDLTHTPVLTYIKPNSGLKNNPLHVIQLAFSSF